MGHLSPKGQRRHAPGWREIAYRFADDRSCLAGFLAMETAELLAGIKPSNLINISNAVQPCGRNLYSLWEAHGPKLIEECGLVWRILRRRPEALLLFVYHPEALGDLLAQRRVTAMLERAGYDATRGRAEVLDRLQERFGEASFPHEIGIFLGYPLKDVAAFLGWISIPFTCQGPWKIYGDPGPSLQLAERHRACRLRMAWRVAVADDPEACLRRAG